MKLLARSYRRLSSNKDCFPSKFVFHQSLTIVNKKNVALANASCSIISTIPFLKLKLTVLIVLVVACECKVYSLFQSWTRARVVSCLLFFGYQNLGCYRRLSTSTCKSLNFLNIISLTSILSIPCSLLLPNSVKIRRQKIYKIMLLHNYEKSRINI